MCIYSPAFPHAAATACPASHLLDALVLVPELQLALGVVGVRFTRRIGNLIHRKLNFKKTIL